jgi:NitT/TauT family transport system permease protein
MSKNGLPKLLATILPPLGFFGLFLLLWHLAVTFFRIEPFLLPGPIPVAKAVSTHFHPLLNAARLTATGALGGFALSLLVGFLVALLFSQSRLIERSLYPYAIFLQTVPIVALAPLIILWIGHGMWGVIAVSFILSVFPVIANTTTGLTAVHADLRDLFALNDASALQVMVKLQIPNAVPYFLDGARISCGLAVIGAIVGEFFAGYGAEDFGLGYLIILTNAQTKTDYLFACILFSTLLGLSFFAVVGLARQRILLRWRGESDH